MIKNVGKKFLSDLKLHSDYLRWRDNVNRYETWEEAIDEILDQHTTKYGGIDISEELSFVRPFMYDRKVLASQRNLQFRGSEVFKHSSRIFNCSVSYIDRPEVFKQAIYLLLSGCGFGFSVEKRYVSKLPTIKRRKDSTVTYEIPDSIEGWSLALDELMNSYFTGGDKIRFDYSAIRPKNSLIAGRFLAPGPEPLKRSLEIIEGLLDGLLGDYIERTLEPIHCYDIICHASDAVLSAGLRRCIAKGSKILVEKGVYKNIEDIIIGDKVKTLGGYKEVTNTFVQGEQSTLLIKHQSGELSCTPNHRIATLNEQNEITWVKAQDLKESSKLIFIIDDYVTVFNDRLPDYNYIKPEHSTSCKDIIIPELDSDIAYLIGIIQGDGYIKLTPNKGIVSISVEGNKPEKKDKIKLILERFGVNVSVLDPTKKDNSYRVNVKSKQLGEYFHKYVKQPKTVLKVPDFILNASPNIKKAFISGIFCSDGSFKTRPAVVCSSVYQSYLIELQLILGELGIHSNIRNRTHPSRKIHWQDLYELTIRGVDNFNKFRSILTITPKKNDRGDMTLANNSSIFKPMVVEGYNVQPIKIESIEKGLNIPTYDIEVNDQHSFMCNGILVHNSALIALFDKDDDNMANSKTGDWYIRNGQRARSNNSVKLIKGQYTREEYDSFASKIKQFGEPGFILVDDERFVTNPCGEIGFIPINPSNGKSCIAFCNLTEINATGINSKSELLNRVKSAVILGTLQSGYNDFSFLGKDTEDLCRWENLLGVSITGWFDNPKLFNEEWLTEAAEYAQQINKEFALKLGINPSARITCTKPSGNASVILGTSSGIHPAHSRNYFRIMQINKDSDVAKWVFEHKPEMIENSVWSANKTDYIIYVPVTESNDAIVKGDISGIEFLEKVKLVQSSWVLPGRDVSLGYSKFVSHNISNTVQVDNWDETFEYLYNNREYFCGVSFLAKTGDKVYKQAPFTSVLMADELFAKYGNGSLFASGLIVDLLYAFDSDLWDACDAIVSKEHFLVGNHLQVLTKKDLIRRAKKYAKNYFKNDIDEMINCLKDTHLFHKWCTIMRNFKPIDLGSILTKPSYLNADELGAISCHGGKCEL